MSDTSSPNPRAPVQTDAYDATAEVYADDGAAEAPDDATDEVYADDARAAADDDQAATAEVYADEAAAEAEAAEERGPQGRRHGDGS